LWIATLVFWTDGSEFADQSSDFTDSTSVAFVASAFVDWTTFGSDFFSWNELFRHINLTNAGTISVDSLAIATSNNLWFTSQNWASTSIFTLDHHLASFANWSVDLVTWFSQSVVFAWATVFSISAIFEFQSAEIVRTNSFADWIEIWEFNGWTSGSMFIVRWRLAWNAFDAIRFATFGAWRVDNSELGFFAGDLGWFLLTRTLFFSE
jgi:hypothetical protein